ncbi:MAG: serine/threonine-protein phosphatase [Actinobacteria bacterium]|nr:serine/threonine-protein phosphatase [Actinomycetota bacterium]
MGAVAGICLGTGQSYGLLPLLSLGPALAAVLLSPARTALVGALAIAVCVPLASYDGMLESIRAIIALVTIAGVTSAGALASAGRLRRERDLADVRAVAKAAQQALLRPVPDRVGSTAIAVRYLSASTAAQVGGDLYEVIAVGGKVRLIVADVQGHGLASVGTAASVLGAFREHGYDAPSLTEIAARIERSLHRYLAGNGGHGAYCEQFATAVLAEIQPGSPPRLEILNCGHPSPLLLRSDAVTYLDPCEPGLPLGLSELLPDPRGTTNLDLGPDDRILFYTDGISEARNRQGQFYALSQAAPLLTAADISTALDQLCSDVVRHVGPRLSDDATALLVSNHAAAVEQPPSTSAAPTLATRLM